MTFHRPGGSRQSAEDQLGAPAQVRPGSDPHAVLIVGVCTGHRCAALRRLSSTDACVPAAAPGSVTTDSEQLLRLAVRDRRDAVLVALPCLGPCDRASIAALGAGVAGENRLTWFGRPSMFGSTELRERAQALADWIVSGAPNPRTLPATLRHTG